MGQAAYDSAVLALAGIQNYWKLTEASGTSFADSQGGNAAVALSDPSRTTGPDGAASAANFAAVTNSIVIPGSAVTMPKDHTVFYWLRLNSQSAGDAMSFEWATASFAKLVQHDIGYVGVAGKSAFSAFYGTVAGATGERCDRSQMPNGTWVFVCETTDTTIGTGDETKVYINAVHVGTSPGGGSHQTQTPGTGTLGIGGRGQGGRALPLDGALNGVGIVSGVLTPTQMQSLRRAMQPLTVTLGQSVETETAQPITARMSGRAIIEPSIGDPNGWNHNAFPGMTRSADGSVLIVGYQHSDQHTGTEGTIRIRRLDAATGAKLGAPFDIRTVLTADPDINLADVSLWRMSNGEIGILWNESSTPGTANINTVVRYMTAFSSDDGVTWSTPAAVSLAFATNAAGAAGAYGIAATAPIELASGDLLVSVYGYDDKTAIQTSGSPGYVKVCKSTNRGRTWTVLATSFPAAASSRDYDETALLLLDDASILSVARTFSYPSGRGSGTACVQMAARSTDNGVTWSAPTITLGSGVVGAVGYGGRPDLAQAPNGVVFLRCRVMQASGSSGYASYRRSDDRGVTWAPGRDPWDLASERTTDPQTDGTTRGLDVYSASTTLPGANDTLAFIWCEERNTGTSPPNKAAMYFRRLTLVSLAVGRAIETDTAQPIRAIKSRVLSQAGESNTAQAVAASLSPHGGPAQATVRFATQATGIKTAIGSHDEASALPPFTISVPGVVERVRFTVLTRATSTTVRLVVVVVGQKAARAPAAAAVTLPTTTAGRKTGRTPATIALRLITQVTGRKTITGSTQAQVRFATQAAGTASTAHAGPANATTRLAANATGAKNAGANGQATVRFGTQAAGAAVLPVAGAAVALIHLTATATAIKTAQGTATTTVHPTPTATGGRSATGGASATVRFASQVSDTPVKAKIIAGDRHAARIRVGRPR